MVETCQFVLTDESKWKAMSGDALDSVCGDSLMGPGYPALPPLCASSLDSALASNDLEQELRYLVTQHRRVRILINVLYLCNESLTVITLSELKLKESIHTTCMIGPSRKALIRADQGGYKVVQRCGDCPWTKYPSF